MNKETLKIFHYMAERPDWIDRLKALREKHSNYKDFYNQAGYLIMELLNTEKEFFDYPRNKIEIKKIADMYF